jgi:hypothetical protein
LFLAHILDHYAGSQDNSSLVSCSQPETVESIVIIVTLPMTKTVFISNQDKYITSVARTAGVSPENVKVLSIDEVSTRSSRIVSARLLMATSVHVQTSVLISMGQLSRSNIKDQGLLNSNLNENGLPSGTLVVQSTSKSVLDITTPSPLPGGSAASGSAASSNVPLGAVIGGTVGFSLLVAVTCLALRFRNQHAV